jgi:hypothetical protein
MKKLAVVSVVVLGLSFVSCEKSDINEEISENNKLEIFQVDPGNIERPGDQGNN